MKLFNIIILLFLLSAFAIGVGLSGEKEWNLVDSAIDNASIVIENITLTDTSYSNQSIDTTGFFLVVEKYIQFVGSLGMEVMRIGIRFGFDNPSHFSPENILYLAKLIIWLIIISLLIQPLGYIIIFIIIGIMWLRDKLKERRKKSPTIMKSNKEFKKEKIVVNE